MPFPHAEQRLRDERAATRAYDAQVADLAAAGVPAIDRPGWEEKKITDLGELSDDAATRTAQWFTPTYAVMATQVLPGGAGADWITLAAHHGHMTVTTTAAGGDVVPDLPADTTATATRVRILTLTPTGADGWIGAQQHLVVTVTLTRTNARTEAANTGIKHLKRTGRGFRNSDNYRARILLSSAARRAA